jgi:hypothetical protein
MQHADRQPTLVQAGIAVAAQVGHHSVTLPTLHDRADDQQEPDNSGDGGSHDRDTTGAEITAGIEDLGLRVLKFGICETLHIRNLALLDPIGMHLIDQRLDRGSQPIPGGSQISLDL